MSSTPTGPPAALRPSRTGRSRFQAIPFEYLTDRGSPPDPQIADGDRSADRPGGQALHQSPQVDRDEQHGHVEECLAMEIARQTFLRKPFPVSELLGLVENLLGG